MKKLERYIRDNREAFDSQEPSDVLWNKIQAKISSNEAGKPHLNGKIVRFERPKWTLRIAASIALLFTLGYFGYNYWKPVSNNFEVSTISPTYAKNLIQFSSLIEEKRQELKQLETNDPQLYHQFDSELKALDANYQNLKSELPKNPNQEELLQSMIQNLQWQIDLLNQQLQIINKIKESKNEKVKTVV